MEKNIFTVGTLIFRNNEILLVEHKKSSEHLTGTYGLPAGRINKDETEKAACARELLEETGLIVEKKHLIELPKIYTAEIKRKTGKEKFSLKIYLCENHSGKLKITDETQPKWIKLTEIKKYNLLPNVENIIKDGLKFKQQKTINF